MGVGDFVANTARKVGDWVSNKAGSEAGNVTRGAVERTNHVHNAGQAGHQGQTAAQAATPQTAAQRAGSILVAVGSEVSPVIKAAAETHGKDAKTQGCAIAGAAVGDVGGKVLGAAAGTAATVGTGGTGVVVGVAVGLGVRQVAEKPIAAVATKICNKIVDAVTSDPEPAKPAGPSKPIQLTNIPIPGVDTVTMTTTPGGGAAGGSMASRLSALTGENLTTVTSNTAPATPTHHNPNPAPASVVRINTPSLAAP